MSVDLALAQALKAAGFPQNVFPQMVWSDGDTQPWYAYEPPKRMTCGHWHENEDESDDGCWSPLDWCAAPDPLSALAWLAHEHGVPVDIHLNTAQGDIYAVGHVRYDTPEALLRACLAARRSDAVTSTPSAAPQTGSSPPGPA